MPQVHNGESQLPSSVFHRLCLLLLYGGCPSLLVGVSLPHLSHREQYSADVCQSFLTTRSKKLVQCSAELTRHRTNRKEMRPQTKNLINCTHKFSKRSTIQ